jgi:hypothetical protein
MEIDFCAHIMINNSVAAHRSKVPALRKKNDQDAA